MVPRMISAGKVSATTIDRSRTTNGWRGSGRAASLGPRRARASAIEIQLGDEDRVLARQPARVGDRRRQLTDETDRCPIAVGERSTPLCPATRNGTRERLEARRRRRARRRAARRRPLTSKKSTSRGAARPVLAARRRRSTRCATPRVSPSAREPRADLEQPHVAPAVPAVVRDRVDQARQQRRAAACRTSRTAGSRRAIDRAARRRRRRNGSAALGLDEAERDRFGQPAAVSDPPHQLIARDARIRRRRRLRSSTGNVASSLSKP